MKKYLAEITYRESDGGAETKTIYDYKTLSEFGNIIGFYNQNECLVFALNKDCFICMNIEECAEMK